jgi:histidinol-phosphate/aromatic aminotransferase/cobyric acid decarboxylase-like protein
VRHYSKPGLSDCVRISVGTAAQNDRVLAALREIAG